MLFLTLKQERQSNEAILGESETLLADGSSCGRSYSTQTRNDLSSINLVVSCLYAVALAAAVLVLPSANNVLFSCRCTGSFIIIILFAIKSMIYKTHGQKQYDRTTRHTNAPTVAHE